MSDETTKAIIESIKITYPQARELPSGHSSDVFFDCIQLTPNSLARLAAQACGDLASDTFDIALGVAYTGIFFAAAVAGGRKVAILQTDGGICGPDLSGKKVLVCDDVICSGSRVSAAIEKAKQAGGTIVGLACIVDRSNGEANLSGLPLYSAYRFQI